MIIKYININKNNVKFEILSHNSANPDMVGIRSYDYNYDYLFIYIK